jgi:hypothetical protein
LLDRPVGCVEDIADLTIAHILDWPKSEIAACLFGANEPPGRLITKDHEFVIIDSELMFATKPCHFDSTRWWGDEDSPTASAVALAKEVCADLLALGEPSLKTALSVPSSIVIQERWPIAPILYKSHAFAQDFISSSGRA